MTKNMDVMPMNTRKRLSEDEIHSMRLRQPAERNRRDIISSVKLFGIMYETAPQWAAEYVQTHHEDNADFAEEDIVKVTHDLATEMTNAAQWLYDLSLDDTQIGHMYGMTHDYATWALGQKLTTPDVNHKGSHFRKPVAHNKRIKEYIHDEKSGAAA